MDSSNIVHNLTANIPTEITLLLDDDNREALQTILPTYEQSREFSKGILRAACQRNASHCVEYILSTFNDLHLQTKRSSAIALKETEEGVVDEAVELSTKGMTNRDKNKSNYLPLQTACRNDAAECLKMMLASGLFDVNKVDRDGCTPLHIACQSGAVKCVQELVKCDKTDLSVTDVFGNTALYCACKAEAIECADKLVKSRKTNIYGLNRMQLSPLMHALMNGAKWRHFVMHTMLNGPQNNADEPMQKLPPIAHNIFQMHLDPGNTLNSYLEFALLNYEHHFCSLNESVQDVIRYMMEVSEKWELQAAALKFIDLVTLRLCIHSDMPQRSPFDAHVSMEHFENIKMICELFISKSCGQQLLESLTVNTSGIYNMPGYLMTHHLKTMGIVLSSIMCRNPELSQMVSAKTMLAGKISEHFTMCMVVYLKDNAVPRDLFHLFSSMIHEILMNFHIPDDENVLPGFPLLPGPGSAVYLSLLDPVLSACSPQTLYRIIDDKYAKVQKPFGAMFDVSGSFIDPMYSAYIKAVVSDRPLKLQQLARKVVFRSLHNPKNKNVEQLPIPSRLKHFITTTKYHFDPHSCVLPDINNKDSLITEKVHETYW